MCTALCVVNFLVTFGQLFVKQLALCYRTVVCPVCLSVTLAYCGQTAGWIKMPLGAEVDLGPLHVVLDGDLLTKGAQQPSPFWPMSIVAKQSPISATAEHLYFECGNARL